MHLCNWVMSAMAYRFFQIPVRDSGAAGEELNRFLRSHRVLSVDRRWVDAGTESFWSFCVDYLEAGQAPGPIPRPPGESRAKVDYREVLSPEHFSAFVKLRALRAEVSKQEGVPVYVVFTNEQLAAMVQAGAASKADLGRIDGVGEARIQKYGERFLACLKAHRDGDHDAAGVKARDGSGGNRSDEGLAPPGPDGCNEGADCRPSRTRGALTMKRVAIVAAVALVAGLPARAQEAMQLAERLTAEGAATFDTKDAKAMAAFYTEDAKVTLISRDQGSSSIQAKVYEGKAAIEGLYRDLFKGDRAIRSKNAIEYARLLRPDALLIVGNFRPDLGSDPVPFVQLRVKRGGRWLMASLQLYVIAPSS